MDFLRRLASKILNRDASDLAEQSEERVFTVPPSEDNQFYDNYVSTTKYNMFTFVPKFLFEQFSKLSNCYFLIIVILQNIPALKHTGKFSTIIPLSFILSVSCLKELFEDFKRYSLDRKTNRTLCKVLEFYWNKVIWSSLVVGSVIKLAEDETCPADIIIISTSNEDHSCYLSTMSLDGETNLKTKEGSKATNDFNTLEHFKHMNIKVKCEVPNSNLYDFNGSIKIGDSPFFPLTDNNIILRGSVIRNTEWVVGVCVYTGHDTKLMQNSVAAPIKRSKFEKVMNSLMIVLFCVQLCLCFVVGAINDVMLHTVYHKHWYLNIEQNPGFTFFYNLGNIILLFHTLIPISFSVTMEFIKLFQAYMMNIDKRMCNLETNTSLAVKTSNIIEDLGQVNFIFTDKTGTLTKNIMTLKRYSVNGEIFDVDLTVQSASTETNEHLMLFYRSMCICSSVTPYNADNLLLSPGVPSAVVFSSSSPDELAMVNYLKEINFTMLKRSSKEVVIYEFGQEQTWKILCMIAFTSERKRMSVIASSPSGEIYIFCKGADSVIFQRKAELGQHCDTITMEHVDLFASSGYRTLCFAYRRLEQTEFDSWFDKYSNSVLCSAEQKEEIYDMIEKDLIIMGVTAVKDELQDNVVDTLDVLKQAGIAIWVLTGDRLDTSINIGHSTGILRNDTSVIIIDEDIEEQLYYRLCELNSDLQSTLSSKGGKVLLPKHKMSYSVVLSGECLEMAVGSLCKYEFLRVVLPAVSVICCRASPIQKKHAVELVKNNVYDMVTLAIGDGGNDCSMIQTANVGVGIYGSEGVQAANSSDFSICQFSHLKPLLLYHGGSFYRRICKTTFYFFYKNFVLTLVEVFYLFNNLYSGTLVASPFFITFFNVFFTALPPFAMGLLDHPISCQAFMNIPSLYWTSQSKVLLSVKKFIYCTINAVIHSALLYYVIYYSFYGIVIDESGIPVNMKQMGYILAPHIIILVTLKGCLEMTSWTWLTHVVMWIGLASYIFILSIICRPFIATKYDPALLDIDISLIKSPLFWMSIPIPLIILVPDFCFFVIRNVFFTPSVVTVGMIERSGNIDWTQESSINYIKQRLRKINLGRTVVMNKYFGFAFSIRE